MDQIHGRPMHPWTQGKIERYYRTMKNVFKLNYYFATGDLVKALEKFIQQYNYEQNQGSLNNLPPVEVYFVRGKVL